jgi:hypothetical protein
MWMEYDGVDDGDDCASTEKQLKTRQEKSHRSKANDDSLDVAVKVILTEDDGPK